MLRMAASAAAPIPAQCRPRRLARFAAHRRPLTRRGGSPPPGSPASISRSPVQRKSGFRPAGAGFGVTPHASLMQVAHARVLPAVFKHFRRLLSPFGASPCQRFVGPSVCSGKSILSHCNRSTFFGPASQSIRPGSPEHTPRFPEHSGRPTLRESAFTDTNDPPRRRSPTSTGFENRDQTLDLLACPSSSPFGCVACHIQILPANNFVGRHKVQSESRCACPATSEPCGFAGFLGRQRSSLKADHPALMAARAPPHGQIRLGEVEEIRIHQSICVQ